ncbi:XdhC family protein [Geodermatophilus sp. URMC 64]
MSVLDTAEALTRARVPFVQATVVRAQRPTSAHAGDTALVRADGVIDGFVGGQCAEASVREYGLRVLSAGEPLLLRIVPDGVGVSADEEGAVTVANPCLSGGSVEIFLEPRVPAPLVVVVGDSPIAEALGELGRPLGFAVRRGSVDDVALDGAEALVVASHGRGEEPALTAALRQGVPYVGLIASRRRGAAVLASLDLPAELTGRVHTPAGLDIGARTAAEIALSVLAEIVAERRSRTAPEVPVAQPVTAVDPVCGMTVAAVDSSLHADVDDVRTWFCGEGCRRAFLADPAAYASA